MPDLYVISILNYDPFGYDYMMYSVHNKCEEVPGLEYRDGLKYIYFYTDGKMGGSKDIKAMLNYIKNSSEVNVVNESTRKVHEYASWVKISPEVKKEYMKFDDIITYERMEGAKDISIQYVCELLEACGEVPDELKERIQSESDVEVLKGWHKLAAKVENVQEFMEQM